MASVLCLVHGQCARLTKTFATIAALERFVFGMNIFVISEMVLATECLTAYIAWEWSFVGVRALMDLQIVAFGEIAFTKLANELLFGPCAIWAGHFSARCSM